MICDPPGRGYSRLMIGWRDRFQRRFNDLKRDEGLTQAKLADQLDVSQGSINNWLSGYRSPRTLEQYEALAKAIKMHPAHLLYGIDERTLSLVRRFEALPSHQQEAVRATINAFDPPKIGTG